MKIEILGTGCPKCTKLAELSETSARELGIDYEMNKVTDITKIMNYGVMMTPALVINGEVKMTGKVPTVEELKEIMKK